MFHQNDWDVKKDITTKEALETAFKSYCKWCREHGSGNCKFCRARMREYLGALSVGGEQDE